MVCPRCNSSNIGKIGKKTYFCRDCNCEFKIEKSEALIYEFDSEGSLSKKYKICISAII